VDRPLIDVWLEIHEAIHNKSGHPFAFCKHCKKVFLHPRRVVGGTSSSLQTHVFDRCPRYHIHKHQFDSTSRIGNLNDFFSSTSGSRPEPITQARIDELLLKYHISGNIPFRQVENQYLKELVSLIEINKLQAKTPGRNTLRARLSKYSKMGVDKLKEVLQANKSRISLALDMWSSRGNHGFLGTLHPTGCLHNLCNIFGLQ
jgi:hypothetical protein